MQKILNTKMPKLYAYEGWKGILRLEIERDSKITKHYGCMLGICEKMIQVTFLPLLKSL